MIVKDIHFRYKAQNPVLDGVSFEIGPGDRLAVLGNNGAGKSTLLKCLNHILRPEKGAVLLDGIDLLALPNKETAKLLSFVAQRSSGGSMTVYDTILLGRKPYMKLRLGQSDYEAVEEVLTRLDLADMADAYLDQLSGGELQKVMLARALAQEPRVLLLDEPTSNLDLKNQYEVMELVTEICGERGLSAIVVMHDLNLALRYCNKLLFLKEGRVYAFGGPEVVTAELLETVYGVRAEVRSEGGHISIQVY